jgi:hypothetical protein
MIERGNALASEAMEHGIPLIGDDAYTRLKESFRKAKEGRLKRTSV